MLAMDSGGSGLGLRLSDYLQRAGDVSASAFPNEGALRHRAPSAVSEHRSLGVISRSGAKAAAKNFELFRPYVRGGPERAARLTACKIRGLSRQTGAEPHAWETGQMNSITYIGLDVHKMTIAVAVAELAARNTVRPTPNVLRPF